jgi:hypothetical protein
VADADTLPLPSDEDGAPRALSRTPDGAIVLVDAAGARAVSAGAIAAIFARWARPLDERVAPPDGGLRLDGEGGGGLRLAALSYRADVDVIANHWFVLSGDGDAPLAVPAPLFVSLIARLARR